MVFFVADGPGKRNFKKRIHTSIVKIINNLEEIKKTESEQISTESRKYFIDLICDLSPFLPEDLKSFALDQLLEFLKLSLNMEYSATDLYLKLNIEGIKAIVRIAPLLNDAQRKIANSLVVQFYDPSDIADILEALIQLYPTLTDDRQRDFSFKIFSELGENHGESVADAIDRIFPSLKGTDDRNRFLGILNKLSQDSNEQVCLASLEGIVNRSPLSVEHKKLLLKLGQDDARRVAALIGKIKDEKEKEYFLDWLNEVSAGQDKARCIKAIESLISIVSLSPEKRMSLLVQLDNYSNDKNQPVRWEVAESLEKIFSNLKNPQEKAWVINLLTKLNRDLDDDVSGRSYKSIDKICFSIRDKNDKVPFLNLITAELKKITESPWYSDKRIVNTLESAGKNFADLEAKSQNTFFTLLEKYNKSNKLYYRYLIIAYACLPGLLSLSKEQRTAGFFRFIEEMTQDKYWPGDKDGKVCLEIITAIDKIFSELTDNQEKEFLFNILIKLRENKNWDGVVRIAANKSICRNFLSLPDELRKSYLGRIIELKEDPNWDLRLEADKILSEFIISKPEPRGFSHFQKLTENFFQFYENELSPYLEEVNNTRHENKRINLSLYLKDILPLSLKFYTYFANEPQEIKKLIASFLANKDFSKLYHFLEVAQKLESKDDILALSDIYTAKKPLSPVGLPDEAKISYWLGRSLIVPLSCDKVQVFKFERSKDGEKLEYELAMLKKYKSKLGLPIESQEIKKIAGKTVLVYVAQSDYFDYADNNYRWLPYEERLARFKKMAKNTLNNILALFDEGLASESLLYLLHHLERIEGGKLDLTLRDVGEIDNPIRAMLYANLALSGIRDLEHLAQISEKLILQNLFEWLLAMSYAGLLNDLKDEDIIGNIGDELSVNNLGMDKDNLAGFVQQLKFDLKDLRDVFYLQKTAVLTELKRLAKSIWEKQEQAANNDNFWKGLKLWSPVLGLGILVLYSQINNFSSLDKMLSPLPLTMGHLINSVPDKKYYQIIDSAL